MEDFEKHFKFGDSSAEKSGGSPEIMELYLDNFISEKIKLVQEKSEFQKQKIQLINNEINTLNQKNIKVQEIQNLKKTEINDLNEGINLLEEHFSEKEKENLAFKEKKRLQINELIEKINSPDANEKKSKKLSIKISIGIAILLTLFLFIFYSSALHGAYIRDVNNELLERFSASSDGSDGFEASNPSSNVTTIINLNSFGDTWSRYGLIGLIFIISAPTVLLGAGLLIYLFKKNTKAIYLVYSLTLLFDIFIAYHIVRDVHVAKHASGLEEHPWMPYLALLKIQFYMILMTGFVGYVLWGILLDFILNEKERVTHYENELNQRNQEIKDADENLMNFKKEQQSKKDLIRENISKTELEINTLGKEIQQNEENIRDLSNKAIEIDSKVPISKSILESEINSFIAGWTSWIERSYDSRDRETKVRLIDRCKEVKNQYLDKLYNSKQFFTFEE